MSKPTRIVGIMVISIMILFTASMRYWGEAFAYFLALLAWYVACVQQSRFDQAQRKIRELEKQIGGKCGGRGQAGENANLVDVAGPAKNGSAVTTLPEMPMELVVRTFLRTVPTCLRIVREETTGTADIPNATIANITVALFLFFLPEYVPFSDQENIYKMRRAFQASWLAVSNVGGDEDGARGWFDLFNRSMVASEPPVNRTAISIAALKVKFPGAANTQSALDVLVYSVWSWMRTINSLVVT